MDKQPQGAWRDNDEDLEDVRRQRGMQKVFGIKDPERWSSCKELIDFLDELLSLEKPVAKKIGRPVRLLMLLVNAVLTSRSTLSLLKATPTKKVLSRW